MSRTGEVIENHISGETMVFLQTAEDTGGELLQIDLFVAPGGEVGAEHVHPLQDETFRIERGELTLSVDGLEEVLRAGDVRVVPRGTRHCWRNSGEGELHAILEFRAAGRFQEFITSYFGLVSAGQVNEDGSPGLLQAAVMLHEYRDTIVLTSMSPVHRRYVMPVLAAFGRALGLRADYAYPRHARLNQGMEIWRAAPLAAAR